jgi:thiol-disulfide isomerase/thioredoxin
MKQKFTLFMLAILFMAAGSFAQGQASQRVLSQKNFQTVTQQTGKNVKQQPSKKSLQMQQSVERQKGFRASVTAHNKLTGKKLAKKPFALRRGAADIISEQPEGTMKVYSRSGSAYVVSLFGVYETSVEGAVGSVVFGADDKVYIKNIVSQANGLNAWVVGTISGSTITIQLPQTVYAFLDEGYNLEAAKMSYDAENQTYVKSADQTVKLNYNVETGDITTPAGKLTTGEDIIGLMYDDDLSWAGYGDWNIAMTAVTDELVEAPAGLTTEQYALTANGYEGSLVQVGFNGDDVYVQGIDHNLPETWVKGTVSGNKVTFKSGQYVGADEVAGYHQYLMSATVTQEWDDWYEEYYDVYTLADTDIEFTYDAETKTLSESTPFLLNCGKDVVSYLYAFNKAKMAKFIEVAATPAAPSAVGLFEGGWSYYLAGYGWGDLEFAITPADVDGNYILPEKLSYQIYTKVNGEVKPLSLSWNDYVYQQEPTMVEIPFGYNDGWDIAANYLYYYIIGPEAYGIQTIYRGAGEEKRSEIVWAETQELGAEIQPAAATPDYPDVTIGETDNRIGYGFYTGEGDIKTVTNNYKPETYDVAIKLDDPTMVGTAIESITFPLQEVEGVSDMSVFLTSQLRVENNKNAADLTVKAVTPAEPGFVTVKLDKPYQIPEGGVYVGYSLTILDATFATNAMPIAVTPEVNEGGLYLHTSDGFLKWIDAAEGFGGSSIIQVTLAGNTIKSNAAAAEVESQFVMTGKEFTVPVTVTNHGAKGIQSFDVTYNIAGKTGTHQFVTAVDAFFGKSTTVYLELPAIAEKGNYELSLNVSKVNDAVNEDAITAATATVVALNTVPKKRTLLEEYTGTWCGWCPRGFVGLEKLAELYPDDYVLVSYHNGDDMEIMSSYSFPSNVEGFPDAWMDRDVELDAYYGINYGVKDLGIADDLAERNKQFGQADINISTALAHDQSTVNIVTEVIFPYDLTDGNYAVEYIVTADGLTNATWGQSNYYANGSQGYPLYMDVFTKGESTVYGLVYNDVAVMTSEMLGGSENTITSATADVPVKLQYSFDLADAVNTSNQPVIQDMAKVKIVALLIDKETGTVVNANKVSLGNPTGIVNVKGNQDTKAEFVDLMGRRVSQPSKGLYITNGRKVVVK